MITKRSISNSSNCTEDVSDGERDTISVGTSEADSEHNEVILVEDLHKENPTFGNVQVKNSTDIHFGNKTYYQGPVTIKQVLYATPEGASDSENTNKALVLDNVLDISSLSRDNLGFVPDNIINKYKEDKTKTNVEPQRAPVIKGTRWLQNFSRQHVLLFSSLIAVLLVSLITLMSVLLTRHQPVINKFPQYPSDSNEQDKGTPVEYPIDPTVNLTLPGKLKIISRKEWLAQPPAQEINQLVLPIPYVVISHTATENCTDQAACTFHIRFLQTYDIESRDYWDIAYNFLVGGDGYAYEGRGWKYEGSHTFGYNSKSIGIGFIGTFNKLVPPVRQLLAAKQLIEKGIELGYVAKNYRLFGQKQLQDTSSPGSLLFEEIKTWPHWSNNEFIH